MDFPSIAVQAPEEADSAQSLLSAIHGAFRSVYPAGAPRDLTQARAPLPSKSEAAALTAASKTAAAANLTPANATASEDAGAQWRSRMFMPPSTAYQPVDMSDANNTITKTGRNSYTGQGKGAASPLNDFFTQMVQRAQMLRAGPSSLGSSLAVGNIAKLLATLGPAMQMQNIQMPQLGLEGRRVALAERTAAPQNAVNEFAAATALGGDPNQAARVKRGAAGEIPSPTTFAQMMSQPFDAMTGQPSGPLVFPQDPGKYAEQARQAQQRGPGAVRP